MIQMTKCSTLFRPSIIQAFERLRQTGILLTSHSRPFPIILGYILGVGSFKCYPEIFQFELWIWVMFLFHSPEAKIFKFILSISNEFSILVHKIEADVFIHSCFLFMMSYVDLTLMHISNFQTHSTCHLTQLEIGHLNLLIISSNISITASPKEY